MIRALVRMADGAAVTILGWTSSDEQASAAAAVAAGAAGALILMVLWRRARKVLVLGVLSAALLLAWIRFGR